MHCKSTRLTDEIQAILLTLILANLHHFLGVTGFGPTFLISCFFGEVFLMVSMWCLGKKTHPKLQNPDLLSHNFSPKRNCAVGAFRFPSKSAREMAPSKGRARPSGHRGSLDTSDTGHTRTSSPRGLPSWDDCNSFMHTLFPIHQNGEQKRKQSWHELFSESLKPPFTGFRSACPWGRNLVNRVRWGLGGASHCNTTVS